MTAPFEVFNELLEHHPASFRAEVACHGADDDWRLLALECRERVEHELCADEVLDYERPKRNQPARRATAPSARADGVSFGHDGDPLRDLDPFEYVEALTGETVPATGWMCCPLPDHEDRTPSFQVLHSHWRCFGCGRGGGVIDFAAHLWAVEPRGRGYLELRQRIAAQLLGEPHA